MLKRFLFGGLFAGSFLLLACAVGLYASAWYHRWRAEQLLRVVQTFQPGETTRTEYERSLRPLMSYTEKVYIWEDGREVDDSDAFGIGNQPGWLNESYRWVPSPLLSLLTKWQVAGGVVFWVVPTFDGDRLSTLVIKEHYGSGHPGGGSVELRAGRVDHWIPEFPGVKFSGYEAQGMSLPDHAPWSSWVWMDERATSEQRKRAMDFKFECFTAFRLCRDGRRVLDPVIVPQD